MCNRQREESAKLVVEMCEGNQAVVYSLLDRFHFFFLPSSCPAPTTSSTFVTMAALVVMVLETIDTKEGDTDNNNNSRKKKRA